MFSLVVIVAVLPWFLVALVPIMAFFYLCTIYFRRAVRQLKRLDSVTRSPLFAHFGSTMSGLLTIRVVWLVGWVVAIFDTSELQ